jgi:hypothetical protein
MLATLEEFSCCWEKEHRQQYKLVTLEAKVRPSMIRMMDQGLLPRFHSKKSWSSNHSHSWSTLTINSKWVEAVMHEYTACIEDSDFGTAILASDHSFTHSSFDRQFCLFLFAESSTSDTGGCAEDSGLSTDFNEFSSHDDVHTTNIFYYERLATKCRIVCRVHMHYHMTEFFDTRANSTESG